MESVVERWVPGFPWTTNSDQLEKMRTLNTIELFENANKRDLDYIASFCEFRQMSEGDTLIEKGDTGRALYIVKEGLVSVRIEREEPPVTQLTTGDYFGEMALLENKPRSAYVVCSESGELLEFSKEGFRELLHKQPKISAKFLFVVARNLSDRLRSMNEEAVECDN